MKAEENTNLDEKSIKNISKKCWNRFRESVSWLCDPEGPAFVSIGFKVFLRLFGIIFIITGILSLVVSYPGFNSIENISLFLQFFLGYNITKFIFNDGINLLRYVASSLIFFGSGLYFVGKHPIVLGLKTAVFNEEIDSLISEVKRSAKGSGLEDDVDTEAKILENFKNAPSEVSQLRLIALRKLHIETIKDFEKLKGLAESDISDFKHYKGVESQNYLDYRNSFNQLYRDWDLKTNEAATKNELSVRLKELRNDLSWEKYWSGQGEAILESITHWSIPAIISLVIMGVTPLLKEPLFQGQLSIINWGLLGMAGAILFATVKMRQLDYSEVGEEEGNLVLRRMLLGMVIGMISAILLFVAIKSGLFGGKALPRFTEPCNLETTKNDIIVRNSLSIFWAIAAGYSAKLIDGMFGTTEKVTNS